jgi:signal transduction histidine kinase
MDKTTKIKLGLITVYLLFALLFFFENHFLGEETLTYHYGTFQFIIAIFTLGVIASAGVYNLAFFIYSHKLHYLYYALAQFSIIALLVNLEGQFIEPFISLYTFEKSLVYLELSQLFVLVFSTLFLQQFLNLYKIKKLERLIHLILFLCLIDLISLVFWSHALIIKFIPSFIWILFLLSEAHRLIEKKDPPFYFLSIGWYGVILISVFEFFEFLLPIEITFPLLHLAFAFESILLSFALSYKFRLMEIEKEKHQAKLLRQSRLASMGEVISIIAHQWRQPLNALSFALMHIKQLTTKNREVQNTIEESNQQLQHMSQTIENFRNFYSPSKTKERFSVYETCQETLSLLEAILKRSDTKVNIDVKKDFKLFGNKNEFQQVILNLVNNARDALLEQEIHNSIIKIDINSHVISIKDDAGGISKENLVNIFDPYFTTKQNGEGLGLYISKLIVEQQMDGKLSVNTSNNQTVFTLDFKNYA